jgi:glycosyltransferase involved in cell wall biosynthesis
VPRGAGPVVTRDRRLRLTVLHARGRGQDHYWSHLWPRVGAFASPRYLAFAGPADDAIVSAHLSPIDVLPDPDEGADLEAAARALLADAPDVVVPQVASALCRHLGFFTALLDRVRAAGVRVVATLHNVLPHDAFPVDLGELARLYAAFDACLVGNEMQRELLGKHFEVGDRPVAIGRHGPSLSLDLGRFDRASARRHLGIPADAPVVLFFGNARPNKGLDLLAEAVPRLAALRPEAFVYVSTTHWLSGRDRPRRVEDALEALERMPGVRVRVEHVPSDEIEPVFRACDVVALPYHAVSQSGLLGVARAFRRPVVATDVFRGVERLAPGEGRIVPARDPQAFAEGLAAQLDDPTPAPPPDAAVWDEHAAGIERVCRAVRRRHGVH